ncbi:hypothetical protein A0J61_03827 [Choanephora cucurbitarum]|uniref:YncI copper-binding domain-containing protein n=1 Tax=Choanephora cucurbitarum TaxID=101091 RepID=A0A1C7NGA1_9FUNG|nr:hypothetical protein A0J61_03827 [Choanephora cucurbitarum]
MAIFRSTLVAACASLALLGSADAHVTLTPKFVEPGQNVSTAFHVPHGCSGSDTISISVSVPDQVSNVKPQQLTNWTLTTEYSDASNTSVKTITWSGGLLGAHDALDFPLNLSVPNVDLSSVSNVTYYFPAIQTCLNGTANWTYVKQGDSGETAPSLVVVKNATQAAADAIAIKANSTSNSTDGHDHASQTGSGANGMYTGVLPFVATVAVLAFAF